MAAERWRALLDTNVLIAGLLSRTGASAAILDLAEAEEILVVMPRQVLVEADRVFLAKFPQLLERYRRFIQNLSPLLADDPAPKMVQEAGEIIEADDAPILAAARQEQVDYLVTVNTRHFHTPKVRSFLYAFGCASGLSRKVPREAAAFFPCPIVTPSEFLFAFRKFWEQAQ